MTLVDDLVATVGTACGEPVQLTAPFTGAPLARIPQATAGDVDDAFRRARAAQKHWAHTPISHRRRVVSGFLARLHGDRNALFDMVQLEGGKARIDAVSELGEAVLGGSQHVRHAEELLRSIDHPGAIPGLTTTSEWRQPKGVVVVVVPWNAPVALGVVDTVPALLAGNTVLLKPDNQTALSTLLMHRAAIDSGIPADVFQVILGEPSVIGDALIDGADYVAFTGSTATGRRIASRAGARLIGCSLELGGKNPMIVLGDANIGRAAAALPRAAFANAGQMCMTTERLYVHTSVYDEFTERACRTASEIRIGASLDFGCDMGSLTTRAALGRVQGYVEQAKAVGARVLSGGRHRPDLGPLFYEPTILADVTAEARLHTEEVFGPVLSIYPFDTVDEAIALANTGDYGLSASIWTRDTRLGAQIASRIQAGAVNINDGYIAAFASHAAPAGGMRASGVGRRHGAAGLLRYTEPQTVAVQRITSLDNRLGLPRGLHGEVLAAAFGVLKNLPR